MRRQERPLTWDASDRGNHARYALWSSGYHGAQFAQGAVSLPLQQIANGCNFGGARSPIYWVRLGLPRTMLLGSVDVVQLQQWSEQHCFGAALVSQITAHTCTCLLSEARASLEMGASDLDTWNHVARSVGVLKLQACSGSSRGRSDSPCSKTPTAVPSAFGGRS
jgi:hypothetical protein